MSQDDARSDVPSISPAEFHVLVALADEDLHGYAIMQAVEEDTRGEVTLGPGTLYGAIKRLVESGCIRQTDATGRPDHDDRRKYYTLTRLGREAARAEAGRLESLVRLARSKPSLELSAGTPAPSRS